MKHVRTRGTALPETALTIGLSLLLVLGAAQMALIGYTQISADGAAFVAAHTQAQNPSISGAAEGASVFSQFNSSSFTTPSPLPDLIQYSVSKGVGGFALVPGVASAYGVTGKDVEYSPNATGATPAPYAFSVSATLINYCDPTQPCSLPNNSHTMYLAQGVGNGNGNGANGIFSEWRCHQKYYASLNWPTNTFPEGYGAIQNTQFDPKWNNSKSVENAIYTWDTGNTKCN
jgi:hypothetical protein